MQENTNLDYAKLVINNIFKDFKSFFENSRKANYIKYKIVNDANKIRAVKKGGDCFIEIPGDIQHLELTDDIEKLYLLFIIGHEISHLVNMHLNYHETEKFDTQSIEAWADFFGAKIAMLIFLNGERFNQMLEKNFRDIDVGINMLGQTIILLYERIYQNSNASSKYFSSNDRASSTIAGIAAYLTRRDMIYQGKFSDEAHGHIGAKWGIHFNMRLAELGVLDVISKNEKQRELSSSSTVKNMVQNIFNIHNQIKGEKAKIIDGLYSEHDYVLDSHFGVHAPNQIMIEEFNKFTSTNIGELKMGSARK